MRTSTIVMIAFAVVFGLLAVFLANAWLNNRAAEQMRSLEAQRKAAPPAHTIVVASRPLRFGDEVSAPSLREVPWPEDALPAGAFDRIGKLTASKRIVLMPIDVNEAILASKITGPGQRATLSAMLRDGMKAVTIRVNDVEGVAGFVLPGDRVDVVLTRPNNKMQVNDVVIQNARVLAVDQLADDTTDKPAVVKAVTLEVDELDGQKLALASKVGTLSLLLRKAGEVAEDQAQQITPTDLRTGNSSFVTIVVTRPSASSKQQESNGNDREPFKRDEYSVPVECGNARSAVVSGPVECGNARSAVVSGQEPAHD